MRQNKILAVKGFRDKKSGEASSTSIRSVDSVILYGYNDLIKIGLTYYFTALLYSMINKHTCNIVTSQFMLV